MEQLLYSRHLREFFKHSKRGKKESAHEATVTDGAAVEYGWKFDAVLRHKRRGRRKPHFGPRNAVDARYAENAESPLVYSAKRRRNTAGGTDE